MIKQIELDENAPEGLQRWYERPPLDLDGLINNPEWIKWLEGKEEYVRAHMDEEFYLTWSLYVRSYNNIPHEVNVYMSSLYERKLRRDILKRCKIKDNALTDEFKEKNQDLFFDDLDLDVQELLDERLSLAEKCEKLMPYKDVLRDKKVHLKFDVAYDDFFEFCESIDVAFDLAIKYGGSCISSIKDWSLDDENKSLTKEEQFRMIVYKNIENHKIRDHESMPEDFKQEYPELFLTEDEKVKINGDSVFTKGDDIAFYLGMLDVRAFRLNKDIAEIMRNKNIRAAIRTDYDWVIDLCGGDADKFITVASEYGALLDNYVLRKRALQLEFDENSDIIEVIDDLVYQCIMKDDMPYNADMISERFQRKHPELFLLPEELQALREEEDKKTQKREDYYRESEKFYRGQISFGELEKNKVLREIIKSKVLARCMDVGSNAEEFISRFAEFFGGDRSKAMDYACDRFAPQLYNLLPGLEGRENIDKILAFYSEMRFVPHHAVIRKIPIDNVEKMARDFKLNSKLWGKLMQNPKYNKNSDSIGSLFEAAMVMGVFETREFVKNGQTMVQGAGQAGFEKLQELLNYAPEFICEDEDFEAILPNEMEELGTGYAQVYPDYIDELIYQAIEQKAKELDIYEDFLEGNISRNDMIELREAFLFDDDFYGNIGEYFAFTSDNKFKCIVDRKMDSKVKVLFDTLGLKNSKVLSQDEFGLLGMADRYYILKAFKETEDGYKFNMSQINGKFVIGDNIEIDDQASKRNKKLFDYIKFLMMEYDLEEKGAKLAANNDRSKIDLVLNKNEIAKIGDAAERIASRAQERYEKRYIFRRKERGKGGWINEYNLHSIFEGLNMIYNESFRDFLLENIEDIVNDEAFHSRMRAVQEKITSMSRDPDYAEIKITPEVVLRELNGFDYRDKKVGFEKGAELASKFGFNQEYFNEAQEIWEDARKRETSNIPRIKGQDEKYSYEVLRLDDATGIFAGDITNCCQKLGGVGESAMIHSMKEKSGRVFVVRDENKKIIAQAWLWRNGNTICFDNVEIPKKSNTHENQTAVYEILKKAAKELCDMDSEAINRLVEDEKIDKEKAELIKAKKVTVGKGNTDIRAIRFNNDMSIEDKENKHPLQSSDYYLYTDDSEHQVILYEAEDYVTSDYSINIHRDENEEKDCKDISKLDIKMMEAIESEIDEQASVEYKDIKNNADLAKLYGVKEDELKLVLGTDWFMLYSEDEKNIEVHKMLRSPSSGVLRKSIREQREAVKMIMDKALEHNKTIITEIENDRVYDFAKIMIEYMGKRYEMNLEEDESDRGHRIEISGVESR